MFVAEQAGLNLYLSETPKIGFLASRPIIVILNVLPYFGKYLADEERAGCFTTLSHDVTSGSDITPCNKIDLQISSVS